MVDCFSKSKRSEIMGRISGKDTKPELVIRSLLHCNGYRFRLHRKDLPGKPDLCLPKYKTVIFVHGCYWHRHKKCKKGQSSPTTNIEFWKEKFAKTVKRDKKSKTELGKTRLECIDYLGMRNKKQRIIRRKLAKKPQKNYYII